MEVQQMFRGRRIEGWQKQSGRRIENELLRLLQEVPYQSSQGSVAFQDPSRFLALSEPLINRSTTDLNFSDCSNSINHLAKSANSCCWLNHK